MSAVHDDGRPLDRAMARAAAQWLMRLHSGEANERDHQACQHWRAADPEHERAWQRAERINQKMGLVPRDIGIATLNRADRRGRRTLLKSLLLAMGTAPAGYLAWQVSEGSWQADHRTATGQRRSLTLADGTRIELNTATAIDVVFSDTARRIVLREGEVLIDTGKDAAWLGRAHRPFIMQTRHGSLRALGTRFVVRQVDGVDAATRLTVMQGAVEVRPLHRQDASLIVQAGQQTRFTDAEVAPVQTADPQAGAWSRGVFFARDLRLGDLIAELDRHRPGVLRCDPAVAGLRISGAFQLANIDNVLAALPDTLPVRLRHRTRWWVTVEALPR